jgi:8-oxo-dGTP pyrophosphatase MutT (NUDIX family)
VEDRGFADRVRQVLSSRTPVRARGEPLRLASVLLPFFAPFEGAAPELWLVRRPDGMRVHGGQVALPGGKHEPEDTDLLSTALREAHEEIGLLPADVDVLGALDDCVTVTGFAVTPYVGWIKRPFVPEPLASEVARVFAAPLAAFEKDPRAISLTWNGSKRIVLSYEAAGETVWGATASILRNFVEVVRGGGAIS